MSRDPGAGATASASASAAADDPARRAEDVDVYANGVAFETVKGWLGRAGEDMRFDDWYGVEDVDVERASRPERLGLGAKFLPHSKATRLMGGVEKKLGRSLGATRQRKREEDASARGGGRWGSRDDGDGDASEEEEEEDEDDEDAGGRAAAAGAGAAAKKRRKVQAWDPTTDASCLAGRAGKKKKKKKKKKTAAAAVDG